MLTSVVTWKFFSVIGLAALSVALVVAGQWMQAIAMTSLGSMIAWDVTDDLNDE